MSSRKECAKKPGKRGMGSIRQKANGSYEYRFPYVDEFYQKRSKSVTRPTIDECVEAAELFKQQIEAKGRTLNENATLCDILLQKVKTDYLKNYTGEQGYGRNLETIKIFERNGIGLMRIVDIKPYHIDQFLTSITEYSDKTISKIYGMLKSAFDLAMMEKVIEVNYMTMYGARRPRSKKKAKVVRGFTEDEQIRFLKALDEHRVTYGKNTYRLQLLIELYSGLRMGEINALKPEDIDFRNKKIHVHRTVARGIDSRPFIRDTTKTEAGIRYVPISDVLVPILHQAIDEMKENPEGLIFYDYNKKRKGSQYRKGGIVETTQVNSFFKRICAKAGITGMGQHSLRHTFATRCIEAGVQAVVLKKWMGHTDIHVTLDTYTDVFDKMHGESTEKFDDLIRELNKRLDNK